MAAGNTIPKTMEAMVLTGHGGMDKLQFHTDWPTPQPGSDEVLVKVHACGLNNTDVNTRSGWYSKQVTEATSGSGHAAVDEEDPTWGAAPIAFPRIQGADMVGTVVGVGSNVDTSWIGKRVMNDGWIRNWNDRESLHGVGFFGSEKDGGFAQYTVVHHQQVVSVESDLTSAELATFSCSYTTAENLLQRLGCGPEDTVLITGASGGVGSAAVQLANRIGATTIALASPAKHQALADLESDVVLDRAPVDLAGELQRTLGRDAVTVVIDVVGGTNFPSLIEVLERGGRYGTSGAIAGPIVELDLRTLYLRDLTFYGSTVTDLAVFPNLVGYIERQEIRPLLAASYPLRELHTAQEAFIHKQHVGNIVVTMD